MKTNLGRFFILLYLTIGVFSACKLPFAGPLAGTEWNLVSLNGKDLIPGTRITATFKGNLINGYTGCNEYNAAMEIENDVFTYIKISSVTEVLCAKPEGRMEQERMYLQTLETVSKYILKDKRLEMKNGDGDNVLIFEGRLP